MTESKSSKNNPLENEIYSSLINHSRLIQSGVSNEQALRIAFGDEVAEKSIADIQQLQFGSLRNQFCRETSKQAFDSQFQPSLDYVIWLEEKIKLILNNH